MERFTSKVLKAGPDDCWEWQAALDSHGYGAFNDAGGMAKAHRVAYRLAFGDPGKMLVCHRCDNRKCCNPGHLFLGTYSDNNRDMVSKGRSRHSFPETRGERNVNAKLTTESVLDIRAKAAGGESLASLGRAYGVTTHTVWAIVHRLKWRHI